MKSLAPIAHTLASGRFDRLPVLVIEHQIVLAVANTLDLAVASRESLKGGGKHDGAILGVCLFFHLSEDLVD